MVARDPVCGMEVQEDSAAAVSQYQGKKYYFCSESCRIAFDRDPVRYLFAPPVPDVPGTAREHGHGAARPPAGKRERIDLPVRGMSCASCAVNIQKSLSRVPGVDKAEVNFATSKAAVVYDPRMVRAEDLVAAVRESGYDIGTVKTDILIEGMVCASCVQKV
ncbi:MAG: YHS domain-containing protein, partial [Candidatus Aminicenantes bacterium]|nr:YHS domain-containing protein [Candidatus Aminicenantes bacterium]